MWQSLEILCRMTNMVKVKVKQSVYRPAGSGGESDIPRFQDSRHMKVVRLSDLRISRRRAYSETTFRRLKSALNKLIIIMMVVAIIIILTSAVVMSVFQRSRLTRIFLTQ
jgi:hypothetical protein